MSLPAAVRRRWGLVDGGEVAFVDLGESLLIVPGSAAELRRELLATVSNRDWRQARSGFGDPDLANE